MNKMPSKKEIIDELVKLFNKDDIEFMEISVDNDTEELYGHPQRYVEVVKTGFKTVTIQLLNRKQHMAFVEKLQKSRY